MNESGELHKTISEEGQKQLFESLKHLTTLSSGSIVLLATFLEKVFRNTEWKFLIGIIFVSLSISLFCSVAAMFLLSYYHVKIEKMAKNAFNMAMKHLSVAYLSFFVGILSLVILAVKNFY